jgi:glycosyltransferase involved in cell wall biosynthesis
MAYAPRTQSGQGLRTYAVVAALARLGPVEVAYRGFDAPEPDASFRALDGVTFISLDLGGGVRRAAAYAAARLRGTPAPWARGAAPSLREAAQAAPDGMRVVADGPTAAAALLGVARTRPVTYNAHNLESSFRATLGLSGPAVERFERRVLATMAESWMVSAADLDGARALCPDANLRLVPNAVDVAAIAPVAPAGERRILFAADHHYRPNAEARDFLVEQVMPRVWREVPDARLALAGRGEIPDPGDTRIEVHGFVDDLGALYARCDAVAVPLLQGGGSPLKFVEALARGLPVVATGHAARGLDVVDGEHYLCGDDTDAFAAALVRALDGQAGALPAKARALAEERYSIEALAEAVRP